MYITGSILLTSSSYSLAYCDIVGVILSPLQGNPLKSFLPGILDHLFSSPSSFLTIAKELKWKLTPYWLLQRCCLQSHLVALDSEIPYFRIRL